MQLTAYGANNTTYLLTVKRLIYDMQARIVELEEAIQKTIDDNLHLADGDNCTLRTLTLALPQPPEEK